MELELNSPLFLINSVTGVALLIVALITLYFPPKNINAFYGYRTSRSMKNDKNWHFAQIYSTRLLIQYCLIYLLFGCIGLFVSMNKTIAIVLAITSLVAFLGLMTYKTEQALKKFEKNENNNRNE